MPVTYNSNSLIPAPFVSVSKEYIRTGDGKKVGATYSISLEGTIVPHKGSPNGAGNFSDSPSDDSITAEEIQSALQNKVAAIRRAFVTDGLKLHITSWSSGGSEWHCFPRISSIDIGDNKYNSPMPYTITFEADEIFQGELGQEDWDYAIENETNERGESFRVQGKKCYLSDVQENWSIDNNGQAKNMGAITSKIGNGGALTTGGKDEKDTWTVTHSLSATGKRAYDKDGLVREPWENAKMWVERFVGPDPKGTDPVDFTSPDELLSNVDDFDWGGLGFDHSEYNVYNHVRTQQIDVHSGNYSINQTWLLADPGGKDALEDINIDKSFDFVSDLHTVTVNGTITGLEKRGDYANRYDMDNYRSSKYQNARTAADVYKSTKCHTLAKERFDLSPVLHSSPLSSSFSHNEATGVISFSFVYNNRAQNVNNSVTENMVINDTLATWAVAQIQIPGRAIGPVLQDLGTRNVASRTVSLTAQFQRGAYTEAPDLDSKITPHRPTLALNASLEWKSADQETWEPWSGRYSRTITWQYQ